MRCYKASDYRLESTIQFILRSTNRIRYAIISEFGVWPTSVVYVGIIVDLENNGEYDRIVRVRLTSNRSTHIRLFIGVYITREH